MRLSEAIREGSKGTKQAFGDYFVGEAACALGAAMLATCNVRPRSAGSVAKWEREYSRYIPMSECHACGAKVVRLASGATVEITSIGDVILHLNDHHRWTREAIADWVQAQEAIHSIGQDAPAEKRELVSA